MEGFHGRAKSGYGSLSRELLQRIYSQPVLDAQDRLRALAVCKLWGSSLAGLPFARLKISDETEQEASLRSKKQLLWIIATQPAIVDLKLENLGASFDLASQALHSINRQALRKLRCWVVHSRCPQCWWTHGLCLPCPAIFPGLESLSVKHMSVGPEWVCRLPRLNHLTCLSLSVSLQEAEDGVLSFPAVPSLRELSLRLNGTGSLVAPWGDMRALRKLAVSSPSGSSVIDLLAGGSGPPQLEALQLEMKHGRVEVDFALLPALKAAQLCCSVLEGAATAGVAASLTRLNFELELENYYTRLSKPWVLELLRNAPPSLRQLGLSGLWSPELAHAVAGLQLHTLSVKSNRENNHELPAGPLWQQLQVLCWNCDWPLPLALRGAPHLHTVIIPLRRFQDLQVLLSLPALKHLRILERKCSAQDEELRLWQKSSFFELLRRALPNLELLESMRLGDLCKLGY